MTLSPSGSNTLSVEVTNISLHGFWLWVDDQEYFLPFDAFPWFREAPISAILHVERFGREHLHWPQLDVDLELDSIRRPDHYPLVARTL